MNAYSMKLEFEKAAAVRDRILAIERVSEKQKVSNISENNIDVIGIAKNEFEVCIEPKYSKFRKSKPLDSKDLTSYSPLNVVGNKENVDFLLAGIMGNGMVNFWISTDGRLFADQGTQLGRTAMEGLQTVLLH